MNYKALVLLGLIILPSCSGSNIFNKNSVNEKLDSYVKEIEEKLPKYITSDFELPTLDDSSYTVEYKCSDINIINNTLIYKDKQYDINTKIKFTVSRGNLTKESEKDISLYSLDLPIGIVKEIFTEKLPLETYNDVFLPTYENYNIKWTSSSSYIFSDKKYNGDNYLYENKKESQRLVYDFPSENKDVTLNMEMNINGYKSKMSFNILFLDNDNIPTLPRVYLNTKDNAPILDKDNYIKSTLILKDNEEETTLEVKVKGRGNSTWGMPKKPYALKFDEKVQLLDGVKSKQWCLLANHADQSLMRNYLGLSLGNKLDGLDWNPTPNYVDLYLNGEYQGNYLLTEKVGAAKEKVNILEDTFDTDAGYLVEMDARASEEGIENEDYFTLSEGNVRTYALKSNEKGDDYYSVEKLLFIKDYMQKSLNAVRSKMNYHSYIDIDSFVDWYIVNEIFMTCDAGYSSVYFNKDKGEKLEIGPLWDLDLSSGNPGHIDSSLRRPDVFYVGRQDKNIWYYYLLRDTYFQEQLKNRWNELYPTLLKEIPNEVFRTFNVICYSAYNNFNKWNNIIGQEYVWYTCVETHNRKTYEEQVQYLYNFLDVRIEWLNNNFNENVFY